MPPPSRFLPWTAAMNDPNRVIVNLTALSHNLRQVRSLVGDGVKILGVVKADAYGHGMLPVARTLEREGVHALGVVHLHEAVHLRTHGITAPVVVFGGVRTREACRMAVDLRLTPVLFDLEAAEVLDQESLRAGRKTAIHLKVDTGMGRLGIPWNEIGLFAEKVLTFKGLFVEALLSHLSSADEKDRGFTEGQTRRFAGAVRTVRSMGAELPLNSLANSAGVMAHKETHFQMVRPGIMLYGGLSAPGFESPVPLKPVMQFTGKVLQVRDLPDGTPVSYGRTYHTVGNRRLAVLSAGYANGLARSMSGHGRVLIHGKPAPITGKICMNLTICDINYHFGVSPGDEVVFLGHQGRHCLTGDDLAGWAGSISYEIFCAVGRLNPKEYTV
jgi:alanine racemase